MTKFNLTLSSHINYNDNLTTILTDTLNLKTNLQVQYSTITKQIIQYNHGYILIRQTRLNIFITISNMNCQNLVTITLGQHNLKTKQKKKSKIATKQLFNLISYYILKFKLYNLEIFFKGYTKSLYKFYKFFIKKKTFNTLYFSIQSNKPHGGCRPSKKRRK